MQIRTQFPQLSSFILFISYLFTQEHGIQVGQEPFAPHERKWKFVEYVRGNGHWRKACVQEKHGESYTGGCGVGAGRKEAD